MTKLRSIPIIRKFLEPNIERSRNVNAESCIIGIQKSTDSSPFCEFSIMESGDMRTNSKKNLINNALLPSSHN